MSKNAKLSEEEILSLLESSHLPSWYPVTVSLSANNTPIASSRGIGAEKEHPGYDPSYIKSDQQWQPFNLKTNKQGSTANVSDPKAPTCSPYNDYRPKENSLV